MPLRKWPLVVIGGRHMFWVAMQVPDIRICLIAFRLDQLVRRSLAACNESPPGCADSHARHYGIAVDDTPQIPGDA
jgi:hypothetical protein